MKMRDNMMDIFNLLSQNEKLLRLLYYKPTNYSDDPLDVNKPNILDMNLDQRWKIIDERIKKTDKVDDLSDNEICRILVHLGRRRSDKGNYLVANQVLNIDVVASYSYEDVDLRLEWICDTINELIFDSRTTGAGKTGFIDGTPIVCPKGYVGYRLIYGFGSVN